MNILLMNLFLFLFPPVVVPIVVPVPVPVVVPAAGNEPAWIWLPMDTPAERALREKARKQWAQRRITLAAIAAGDARKARIAENRNYQIQLYRKQQEWYLQQSRYRSSYYNNSNSYTQRWRMIYINTPTGRVGYWVPY